MTSVSTARSLGNTLAASLAPPIEARTGSSNVSMAWSRSAMAGFAIAFKAVCTARIFGWECHAYGDVYGDQSEDLEYRDHDSLKINTI